MFLAETSFSQFNPNPSNDLKSKSSVLNYLLSGRLYLTSGRILFTMGIYISLHEFVQGMKLENMSDTSRLFRGRRHCATSWSLSTVFEKKDWRFQKSKTLDPEKMFCLGSRPGYKNSPLQRGHHPQP